MQRGRRRKNDVPVQKHGDVIEAYQNGATLMDLAEKYKVTTYVIKGILNINGVKARPQGKRKMLTHDELVDLQLTDPLGE